MDGYDDGAYRVRVLVDNFAKHGDYRQIGSFGEYNNNNKQSGSTCRESESCEEIYSKTVCIGNQNTELKKYFEQKRKGFGVERLHQARPECTLCNPSHAMLYLTMIIHQAKIEFHQPKWEPVRKIVCCPFESIRCVSKVSSEEPTVVRWDIHLK